jgi:hypothetical protein
MTATRKITTLLSYAVVVVLLLVAFGFTLAYVAGDQLRLPFHL